ncbi:MAG: hypothetical protein AB7Q97_04760 [Gammaproteobacteria bacterium]
MSKHADAHFEALRRRALRWLAAGTLGAPAGLWLLPAARAQTRPGRLPAGRSIHAIEGQVTINGAPATAGSRITAADRIETGPDGRLVFAVGQDAFLLRPRSGLTLAGSGAVVETLRLVTGKLLTVFARRPHVVQTPVATIGIRGTGVYVEAEPDQSYVCTCYGQTEIAAAADPGTREEISTTHHDAPRYVVAQGGSVAIRPAPMKNHTDDELFLLEALVGRTPPFDPADYETPRRRRY